MGTELEDRVAGVRSLADAIRGALGQVIEGKAEAIQLLLTALLAEGHLLIEDVPGVGKTMLARSLAKAIDGSSHRIQFTPDLLPGDITGVSVFNQSSNSFEFKPGSIFANVVIGDEINRASPKTQSALLEAMAERGVSIDGQTHRLPRPFLVIATQNPIEMEGTYALPEAQRDRFALRISMGYPDAAAEVRMLEQHGEREPIDSLRSITTAAELSRAIETVRQVFVHPALREYVVAILNHTRAHPKARLGASPRAGLQLLRLAQARAAMSGRSYIVPDDLRDLAQPALAHRVLVTTSAQLAGLTSTELVAEALVAAPVPRKQ